MDLKKKEQNDFFAKLLVEILGNEIPSPIREKWIQNLQSKGMFYSTYNRPKLEPGDIVSDYDVISDPLIFNDKILEKRLERKLDFVVRKINDYGKSDDSNQNDSENSR